MRNSANQPHPIDRRTFLKLSSSGAALLAGTWAASGQQPAPAPAPAAPPAKSDNPRFRILGRTGLKLSIVGFGAMRTSEPAVMQAAFDRGVNYIDTAYVYMNGNNERFVGEALKGYRDKVFVATKINSKIPQTDKAAIIASLDESLGRLGIDYVDVVQLHHPSPDVLLASEPKEALAELRKQGKARFVGLTSHSDEVNVLNAVLKDPDKFYDMVLVTYNYKSAPQLKEAIARVAGANIGVVAMKTQEGGYKTKELGDVSPHQAALKYVLSDPNVTAAIPAMVDLAQVEEDTAVLNMLKLSRADIEILERYSAAIAPYYCHRCGACVHTCPLRVDVPTANRALMYAEGYRDLALARGTFDEIDPGRSPAACGSCTTCSAKCPNGLDVCERMNAARALLA